MNINELFSIIEKAWYADRSFSLNSELISGSPAAIQIKGHFKNGIILLTNADKPVLNGSQILIQSANPDQLITVNKTGKAKLVWTIEKELAELELLLTLNDQTPSGFSLAELYPALKPLYLSDYHFTEIGFEINSKLIPFDFEKTQSYYAPSLYQPNPQTNYSAQLKFTGKLRWPDKLKSLETVFGKDGFDCSGYFQIVNTVPRFSILVNGTEIQIHKLKSKTNLQLLGLLCNSEDEPGATSVPDPDALQILIGTFTVPDDPSSQPIQFETYWQNATPRMLNVQSQPIKNIPQTLEKVSKALLGIDLPNWSNIPGLPWLATFNLEALSMSFDTKQLQVDSIRLALSLLNEKDRFTLINDFLWLDKIGIELAVSRSPQGMNFTGLLSGNLKMENAVVKDSFATQISLPDCTFSIGLSETSTLDAAALLRKAIPGLPENLSLVIDELNLTGNILKKTCSFAIGLTADAGIDFFLFKLNSLGFYFDYSNGETFTKSGAQAELVATLQISEQLEASLMGSISSGNWKFEGSIQAEKKTPLKELLPAGIKLPQEILNHEFESASISLSRGKETEVEFTISGNLKIPFGSYGELNVETLTLSYWASADDYEWSITSSGSIKLIKENPADSEWLIHGEGELSITGSKKEFAIAFTSTDGIKIERLPLLLPYNVSTSPIEWSEISFTLQKFSFGKSEELGWNFDTEFRLIPVRLPKPFSKIIPKEGFDAQLIINKNGATIGLKTPFLYYDIPVIIPAMEHMPAMDLGMSRILLSKLELKIGKTVSVECSIKYRLPEKTNLIFGKNEQTQEPKLRIFETFNPASPDTGKAFEVTFYAKVGGNGFDIGAKISELPIIPLVKKGEFYLLNLGPIPPGEEYGTYGCFEFKIPEFKFDMKKGGFSLKGGFGIKKMLAIPLKPFKNVIRNGEMKKWAENLPDSLPVPFPFDPKMLIGNALDVTETKKFYRIVFNSEMPGPLEDFLKKISGIAARLPEGLKSYFKLNGPPPAEGKESTFRLEFEFTIRPDGGVNIKLDCEPGLKLLSFTPIAVQGMTLRSFSFGTLLAGQLFSTRIDADFDQFDFAQLITSLALPPDSPAYKYLGNPANYGTKLTLKELFIIIIYQTQIPIPIPIFYKELGISYYGIGDFGLKAGIGFPEPSLDLAEMGTMLGDLIRFVKEEKFLFDIDKIYENFKIAFQVMPSYITLPQVAGGKQYGMLEKWELSLYKIMATLLNSIKSFDLKYVIQVLPVDKRFGVGNDAMKIQFFGMEIKVEWLLTTPNEFMAQGAYKKLFAENEKDKAAELFAILPGPNPDTPVKPEDKGLIAFLRGSWTTNYSNFESYFGLVALSVREFRFGMRLKGKVSGLFDFEAIAYAQVQPTDPNFYMYGNQKTKINIGALQLFNGHSNVVISSNNFSADGRFDLLNADSLIYLGGNYKGNFDRNLFNLSGGLKGKLLVFELEGDGRIASNGIGGSIGFPGTPKTGFDITVTSGNIRFALGLNLGWTNFSSTVVLGTNVNPDIDLKMNSSSFAGLLSADLIFITKASNRGFNGEFILKMLGNPVINGWVRINGNDLAAGGKFLLSLIPGTSIDVDVKGEITASKFLLSGTGTLNVTGLPSSSCFISIGTDGVTGKVTILKVDYGFKIGSCNGEFIIVLRAFNITSYIDRHGFHLGKNPPCPFSDVPQLRQTQKPCRLQVGRKTYLEVLQFAQENIDKIKSTRSKKWKEINSTRRNELDIRLLAIREKNPTGKSLHKFLLRIEPENQSQKLIAEMRKEIDLILRTNRVHYDLNFSKCWLELEMDISNSKAISFIRLNLPEETNKQLHKITYKFKNRTPEHAFVETIAEAIIQVIRKKKGKQKASTGLKAAGKTKESRLSKKTTKQKSGQKRKKKTVVKLVP
jgi:hypothetical protein